MPEAFASGPTTSSSPEPVEGGRETRVLLLYAEDRLAPAFVAQDEAFRNTLQSHWPRPIAFNTEYLEFLRRPGEAEQKLMIELLERKYHSRRPDLVVTSTSVGLQFVLANRARLFDRIPVVFMSVHREPMGKLPIASDVTGTWLTVDWAGTLDALEVDLPRLHADLARQRAQALENLRGTHGIGLDVADRCTSLVDVDAGAHHTPRRLGVRDDRGQRLTHLVGNRRHEAAQRGHPHRGGQLLALQPRALGLAAPTPLHEQRGDERALGQDDEDHSDHVPVVRLPQRRLTEPQHAAWHQSALIEPPAPQLRPVENGHGRHVDG